MGCVVPAPWPAAWHAPRTSLDHAIFEVCHAGRFDRSDLLKPKVRQAEIVEQTLAAPEKERNQRDVHLVNQPGGQILLRDICSAGEYDVLPLGRLARVPVPQPTSRTDSPS